MSGRRRKKLFLQALLSSLFLLLVFAGAWYFAVTYKPPTTQEYVDRAETYLEDWANSIGVEAKIHGSTYWDWIDEDGTLLPLTGNEFYLGTLDVNGIGQYGTVSSQHLEKVTAKFFQPLLEDTASYFEKSRFVADSTNDRKNDKDPTRSIRRGYQHGKLYCLLRLTPQSDPFGALFCGTIDEKQQRLQKKVRGLFTTKYNAKHFASFRVTKIDRDFALGVDLEDTGGYTWIAKKSDDAWKILWKGQDIPLCSMMEENSIPKSIYLTCINDGTNPKK